MLRHTQIFLTKPSVQVGKCAKVRENFFILLLPGVQSKLALILNLKRLGRHWRGSGRLA
jgi:hypothetical protein